MEELQKLYTGYLDAVEQAQKKLVPASGLFGIGKRLSDDRCHDDFLEALGAYLAKKADTAASQEAREILERVYDAPIRYQDAPSAVDWIFIAAHGLTRPLIRRLSRQDAQRLLSWYQETYPRRERLPIQNQVLKDLKAIA